jgi:YesN/AraC family two-component response regulator
VITSGFSDFEYAKKAITLKVSDYLLKPVDPDELRNVLLKIKQELQIKRDVGLVLIDTIDIEIDVVCFNREDIVEVLIFKLNIYNTSLSQTNDDSRSQCKDILINCQFQMTRKL